MKTKQTEETFVSHFLWDRAAGWTPARWWVPESGGQRGWRIHSVQAWTCRLGAAAVCLLAEAWNCTITTKEEKVARSHRFLVAVLIPVTDAGLQPISIGGLAWDRWPFSSGGWRVPFSLSGPCFNPLPNRKSRWWGEFIFPRSSGLRDDPSLQFCLGFFSLWFHVRSARSFAFQHQTHDHGFLC